jgi:hypothetical protein
MMNIVQRLLRNLRRQRFGLEGDGRHLSLSSGVLHRASVKDGPGLEYFIANSTSASGLHGSKVTNFKPPDLAEENIPYMHEYSGGNQKGSEAR